MQPIYIYHLQHIQLLNRHVSQLILQAENAPLVYQAGQYIKIMHKDNSDSPMSIACAPAANALLELHVSHPPKNHKAHDILRMIKQDAQLPLRGPYGDCTLARVSRSEPIIFFVRGTGIAPVKAILEELAKGGDYPPMHLYWAAAQEDFYFLDVVKGWQKNFTGFRYTQVASRSVDQHKLQHMVMSDYPDLSRHQVYASGSVEMVQMALPAFLQHGLQEGRFFSDIFGFDPNA